MYRILSKCSLREHGEDMLLTDVLFRKGKGSGNSGDAKDAPGMEILRIWRIFSPYFHREHHEIMGQKYEIFIWSAFPGHCVVILGISHPSRSIILGE